MSSIRGQRIQTNCQILWGPGDYELDVETDDWEWWYAFVRKDYGTSFGEPMIMTGICPSEEDTWKELDRMLDVWAAQKRSGRPMTEDKALEIFGGRRGETKPLLKTFLAKLSEIRHKTDSKDGSTK